MKTDVPQSTNSARRRQAGSAQVRESILVAAAEEFAAHGFDGASTRQIAQRAGVYQAQLGYHVGTKLELWKATVDRLFERLRDVLVTNLDAEPSGSDPAVVLAAAVRAHVRHTSINPQLQRIMALEATSPSDRVDHLLERHVRPLFGLLEHLWSDVRQSGQGAVADASWVFMAMIGLGPLPFVQSAILGPLLGPDVADPDAHAERLVQMLVPGVGPSVKGAVE